MQMLEDGVKLNNNDSLAVKDIAEVLRDTIFSQKH
jgi:hypothetical protein